ncbi:hypothetical protein CLI64_11110 [Nostoc sp. CENA543]|uniref:AraC family transcriptional regulator n=1 Tax=Nostoc sp. CENA543 TaxID=1869241 RepID=UPI000CA37CA5|nr:AraC family transcriptional regulator [Nostoc sp. CENA543]AUT00903.1 hypothetical protein CLI64_11110 [Nostoc sp. CENA543]
MLDIPQEKLESLFRRHLDGEPTCRLAKEVGVSDNTLARRFRKYFGYSKHGNNFLSDIVNEYLTDPAFKRHHASIKSWYDQHTHLIVREGQLATRPAYTEKALKAACISENRKLIVSTKNAKPNPYSTREEFDANLLYQYTRLGRSSL